jgi:ATP phosphoribosyltransferase
VERLTIAVPKGRLLEPALDLFARIGLAAKIAEESRALVAPSADGRARFLIAKPMDVPTFVEYGTADVGVVGSDILAEEEHDVLQPLDLRFGACRLVLAAPHDAATDPLPPHAVHRIATKYPNTTARYFARRGLQAEAIRLYGSVELAPSTGLSALIVDLVQTGATLRENGLVVIDEIAATSARLVVNRAAQKIRFAEIDALVRALAEEVTT